MDVDQLYNVSLNRIKSTKNCLFSFFKRKNNHGPPNRVFYLPLLLFWRLSRLNYSRKYETILKTHYFKFLMWEEEKIMLLNK